MVLASGVALALWRLAFLHLALSLAGRIWRFEHLALGVGPLDENVTGFGWVLNLRGPRCGQ